VNKIKDFWCISTVEGETKIAAILEFVHRKKEGKTTECLR
jgi:hypothetical protein